MSSRKRLSSAPPTSDVVPFGRVLLHPLETEMRTSYLDYAMSVIVSRALPDVRDGLKPVHRRILYAMSQLGLHPNGRFRKSAAVVGEVLAKYHPHGDSAVYDSMVRMAQEFAMRAPLVWGQGNFGSIDGDSAAAMRYTEAKLTAAAEELLTDLEKDTVDFVPNYDGTTTEPKVLPARVPNLLVNGTVGIAVGMATDIPPHNLGEVCAATRALLADPDLELDALMEHVPGPDFPTAGIAYGREDIRQALVTGKGGFVVRGKAEIVELRGDPAIVISELPYQVNKATFVTHIADLVREKKIEGIRDLRDESDRDGIRVVVELKAGAYPKKILNALYEYTELQTSVHYNMLALVDGIQPRVLTLKDVLLYFIDHRRVVIRRRSEYDLARTRDRIHILDGLKIAIDHIDAVINIIRKSADRDAARIALIAKYNLSEIQANAILDMRLAQLANLERQKVEDELAEKKKYAAELVDLLAHPKKMDKVIDRELIEVATKHATPRKTQLIAARVKEFSETDLIPDEPTIVTITRTGYIKRLPPDTFRTQGRGGKGVRGIATADEDMVEHFLATTTHANLLFFTTRGRVFELKAYEIPVGSRTAKGSLIVNFLQLAPEEKVTTVLSTEDYKGSEYLLMVTRGGIVKKSKLSDFNNIRRSGLIAIRLRTSDLLQWVKPTTGKDEVLLVTERGQSVRFRETQVRPMGRAAGGVIGIRLHKGDAVVGMDVISRGASETHLQVFVITKNGFGKRTPLKAYRVQGRGGSGIKTAKCTSKTGNIVAAHVIHAQEAEAEDMVVISGHGQVIRLPFKSVSISGRQTQGVRLMRFKESGESVASVTFL